MSGSCEPLEISVSPLCFHGYLFPSFNTVFSLGKWILKTHSDREIKREEILSPAKNERPKDRKNNASFILKKAY